MITNLFLNHQRVLRSGWWIAIFMAVMAGLLLPLIFMARDGGGDVPVYQQAGVILLASLVCQMLRRKPIGELLGRLDLLWPRQLMVGAVLGAGLMAVPALVFGVLGVVSWRFNADGLSAIGPVLAVLAAAAVTEELMFRGFVFQRLIDGIGAWPAQIAVGAFFVLTHSEALKGIGDLGFLAGANIFLASILFGLAFLRTRSLAMPLGLHFAANAMQGPVLGFGVSGSDEPGLLTVVSHGGPDWLTGGAFGLEASVPGIVCVIAMIGVVWTWVPKLR